MPTQQDKAARFVQLHAGPRCFLIPNPWDTGSARLLEHMGFEALATTSAGFAFSHGRPDMGVTREQKMAHLRELCAATALPVSADLQNGFGDRPEDAAETIRQAAAAGAVGGSIEDASGEGGADGGCRPSRRPAPTCCSRPACASSRMCARCWPRSTARST